MLAVCSKYPYILVGLYFLWNKTTVFLYSSMMRYSFIESYNVLI